MKKQDLLEKIDQTALAICHLMAEEVRDDFFNYQERRHESGEGYNKKYFVGRTYYKGVRKGEIREVFEIDGRGFNNLWSLLTAFAAKSVSNFYSSRRMYLDEEQEDLFDIKYQTLYVLRFFGPSPNGVPFSQFFPLICPNILSTSSRRRYGVKEKKFTKEEGEDLVERGKKNLIEEDGGFVKKAMPANKTKINYQTVSLYDNVLLEEEEGSDAYVSYITSDNWVSAKEMEFSASIPDDMKECVENLLEGRSLRETSKLTGLNYDRLKNKLKEMVLDFYV